MKSSWPLFCLLAILTFCLSIAGSPAQDDLTIPGVDDKPVTAAEPEPADKGEKGASEGGASTGGKSLWDMIKEGGWAMWPLGAMSVAIVALSVYCFMDIAKKNFDPPELVAKLDSDFQNGDFESAMQTAEASPTCLGQVVHGATEFIYERGYEVLDGDTIYDLMADASQDFNRGRAGTINYFSVISQAAPMLGLLGTVSGMIKAFANLSSGGMGDPGKLAANISEALMTTATGLVIALPAIFAYFFFRDRMSRMIADVDRHANRMLNSLRRVVYGQYEESGEQHAEHGHEAAVDGGEV